MGLLDRLFGIREPLAFHRQAPPPSLPEPASTPYEKDLARLVDDYDRIAKERDVDLATEFDLLNMAAFVEPYRVRRDAYRARSRVIFAVETCNWDEEFRRYETP